MIRKALYIAGCLCLTVTLGGCSDSEGLERQFQPKNYIIFGRPGIDIEAGVSGFSTRADLTTSLSEFKVWGFRRPMSINGVADEAGASKTWNETSIFFTNGADVFSGMSVKISGGSTGYDYNNNGKNDPKAWDDSRASSYTFIAGAAPSGTFSMENAVASTGSAHGPRLKFTLPANDSALNTPLDYKQQPDAMIAGTFDRHCDDGIVSLTFSHFMTGIRFRFHNRTTDKDLVIKKVTFRGQFYKEAVFDLTTDKIKMSVTDTYYSGTFTLLDGSQTISAGTSDLMGGDATPTTLLLLPNPNAQLNSDNLDNPIDEFALGKNKTIEITYSIGGGEDKTYTLSDFRLNYLPDTNTLHTANFNFVGDEFIVMFQANNDTNWGNGSDNDVDIH